MNKLINDPVLRGEIASVLTIAGWVFCEKKTAFGVMLMISVLYRLAESLIDSRERRIARETRDDVEKVERIEKISHLCSDIVISGFGKHTRNLF